MVNLFSLFCFVIFLNSFSNTILASKMKFPAIRSIAKINSDVYQNSCRFLSYKFEMTPTNRLITSEKTEEEAKSAQPAPSEQPQKANFRYTVCQPRTTTLERPNIDDTGNVQNQTVKTAIEQQHLQPAMLPEFFQRQMERNVLVNPEPEPSEETMINKGHNAHSHRKFQVSKTCANATLPLKSVKLANPFPEPVKMMMSRTVADDEKAEQMLAEAKNQRQVSSATSKKGPSSNFRSFSTQVKRWYSESVKKDGKKCKKVSAKRTCPRMTLPCCPPRARTKCDRLAKSKRCKKQEAPYPAYSEFCHEDVEEKPSECKMCPWKPEDNPNFKPPKKNLHTTSITMLRRSGLEMDYQKKDVTEEEENREGMQCDLRKPQCERPKNRRCPPSKDKKKEEKKKPPKKKCESFTEMLEEGSAVPADALEPSYSLNKYRSPPDGCKKPKEKCKKFKFPEEKLQQKTVNRCPTKKKKPKIRDCPGPCGGGCKANPEEATEEYQLSGDVGDKERRKCPDVDMSVDKEQMKDRCWKPRKEGTKKCPSDLLKKKSRTPKRKTSSAQIDIPQPQAPR